ncbi:MAG: hypothetical protein EOP48_14970 [Sphingobacteriales bacterium]|nr:MAG: hypothetical protein EOP48_14970 [Sphingobacteriales bacterium]
MSAPFLTKTWTHPAVIVHLVCIHPELGIGQIGTILVRDESWNKTGNVLKDCCWLGYANILNLSSDGCI